MARGDVVVFNTGKENLMDGTHDIDTHTFKVAICDNTTAPTATTATPALADFTQVGTGGTYISGGTALTLTWVESGGTVTWAFSNSPTWASDAGNDVDAYWGIVYNDTNVGKEAVAYIDLGGPVDMTAGALTINAGTLFTLA